MDISFNAIFTNCYHFIKDKLSNLTPLQRRVALVALGYFTCAAIGYFIYRYCCFQARSLSGREEEDHFVPVDSEYHREKPRAAYRNAKLAAVKGVDDVSKQQFEPKSEPIIEKKTILTEEPLDLKKDLNLDQASPDPLDLAKDLKEPDDLYDTEPKKFFKEPEQLKLSDCAKLVDLPDLTKGLKMLDLSECDKLTDAKKEFDPSQDQQVRETREQEIERRLEKNRKFAQEQQEKEKAKGFRIELGDIPQQHDGNPLINENLHLHTRRIGNASCQGTRAAMEDESLVAEISFSTGNQVQQAELFAIFDGHGGANASKYAKEKLASYFKEAFEKYNQDALTDVGIWDALKDCFKKLDADYQGIDGTTATVAIRLGDRIWIANVGDSRTILVQKDGKAIQASEDAKPNIARYQKTIEKLGGAVYTLFGHSRVNGSLAVARAIGDKRVIGKDNQCCVSPNPKITCYSLKDFQGGYLVLACDGLYDVATTDEVGQAIKQMADQGIPTNKMPLHLVYGALVNGSTDNVSVMVAAL